MSGVNNKSTYKVLSSGTSEVNIELARISPISKRLNANWRRGTTYEPIQSSYSPEVIPERQQKWLKSGWRVGATSAAMLASLSLTINLVVTVYISQSFPFANGISSVYTGNCSVVQRYDTWIHFAINAISTALLSGSNYCMQVLCAPNRGEVDKAHSQRRFLDIGVPSIRNLGLIRTKKLLLWLLLGMSSVPLHLMYNSIFFSSLSTNDYNIYFAQESFLNGSSYDHTKFPDTQKSFYYNASYVQQSVQQNASSWKKLSNKNCIAAYTAYLISDRRDVILIHSNSSASSLNDHQPYVSDLVGSMTTNSYDPYGWICNDDQLENKIKAADLVYGPTDRWGDAQCNVLVNQLEAISDQWTPSKFKVQYCMSEIVEGKCSLNFSLPIAIVIMVCNIAKIIAMCYVAFGIKDNPLITFGDAVSSFLERRDITTEGACLVTADYFRKRWNDVDHSGTLRQEELGEQPVSFHRQQRHLRSAASGGRWFALVGVFTFALAAIVGLMVYGIISLRGTDSSAAALWALGFGTAREESLISGLAFPNIISAVLLANLPQTMLSFLYLMFNGLLTAMLSAQEWSHFAYERKPLRVSTARGMQRSTYFLQLPYRFALPLMTLSGLLHWLVSQSLFIANITTTRRNGFANPEDTISTCGYSPMAMIFTLCLGGCMLAFIISCGFWRYTSNIPIVGSCSAAISAACHAPELQKSAHLLPLQWGVIPEMSKGDIGHCSFSVEAVEEPIEGAKYA